MGKTATKVGLVIVVLGAIAAGSFAVFLRLGTSPRWTIGLVYIPTRAFHEYVNGLLAKKIEADSRFSLMEFTAASGSDSILINSAANEALNSNADVIIATGLACSRAVVEVSTKRRSLKPAIILGVADLVGNNLVDSIEKPGKNVTGIESNPGGGNTFDLATLAHAVKPHIKRILLPYADTPGGNESHAKRIKKAGARQNITVTLLPLDSMQDALLKTATLLPTHDVLMYLEADLLAAYAPGLGKLASQHKVTMFAGSTDGVKDAALGYAPDPAILADLAFDIAKQVLIDGKKPADIPVQQATVQRNFTINTHLCAEQDLADIDIPAIIDRIRSNPALAEIHEHIIINP